MWLRGLVSMVEVMMGCLLLRLPLDESKEKGLFSKAGINNWNRSAKEMWGNGKCNVMLFLMVQGAFCVSKLFWHCQLLISSIQTGCVYGLVMGYCQWLLVELLNGDLSGIVWTPYKWSCIFLFYFFISPFCQDNETNKSRFREQNWSNQMVSQVKIVTTEIS